jgi:hypothetical protein
MLANLGLVPGRKSIVAAITFSSLVVLLGVPRGFAPSHISVSVSPTSASVQAGGGTRSFTATVRNDRNNRGVRWSLSGTGCSGSACGTLSATSSASGVPVTYTAPGTESSLGKSDS